MPATSPAIPFPGPTRAGGPLLAALVRALSSAGSLDEVMDAVIPAVRELLGADGATFVLREGDHCFYAGEQAIGPLWKGRRFPAASCISGWCMSNGQGVAIDDIALDDRIPAEAYRPTFVRSLAMVPVRPADPVAAIGAYWAVPGRASAADSDLLRAIADATCLALAHLELQCAHAALRIEVEERKRMEAALLQAQRLEGVGLLTGGIAHDFNNHLAIIQGSLEILEGQPLCPVGRRGLVDAQGAVDRGAQLIGQLLAFARRQPLEQEMLDLGQVVSQLSGLLGRSLGGGVVTETEIPAKPCRLRGNRGQLENVLLNLAINARDAMPAGGRLVFRVVPVPAGDGSRVPPRVLLEVEDSGIGMSEDIRARAAQPFFTTRADSGGSGLGLSLAQGFARQCGGTLAIDSEPGRGTRVRLLLPAAAPEEQGRQEENGSAGAPGPAPCDRRMR